jgi:hypothetical protein
MLILIIILKILIDLLLIFLGLALALLLIPFSYTGQVMTSEGFKAQFVLGWAWKMLGINAEIEGDAYDITFRVMNKRVYKLINRTGREEEKETNKPSEKKDKRKKIKKIGKGLT